MYRAGFAVEQPWEWEDDLWTLHAELQDGIDHVQSFVERVQTALNADAVVMALSSPINFRKEVMPEYKTNRKKQRKPVISVPLREFIQQEYECYVRDGLEGDDVLGILATSKKAIPGEKIIVSVDKDMGTLPCKWLNDADATARIATGEESSRLEDYIVESTLEEADLFHLQQTIAGDPTDGYGGCPGVGMVNAERILNEGKVLEPYEHTFKSGPRKGQVETRWKPADEPAEHLWDVVVSVYKKCGLNEDVALQNARVARICRAEDWDFKKGCVKLWQPKRNKSNTKSAKS